MSAGFNSQCKPQYRLLTESQIKELHRSTLELLEKTGVKVHHPEALEMLRKEGCTVVDENIVKIPGRLVDESIKKAPSAVPVYNRNGDPAMDLTGNNVYFGMGTDLLSFYDLETGELRPSKLQDVIDSATVGDWCPEMDFIASNAFPNDVEGNLAYAIEFKALMATSSKPIYFTAGGPADLAVIIEMAKKVKGGADQLREKPFMVHYAEPISPLVHSKGAVEKLFMCAESGVPLNYVPALLSGGSGPVTMAGAIVTANAEALSGLVMQQLRVPGAPAVTGFSATPMDMRTGTTVYASPDERLTHSACCDLYHYYGLPVWGEAGCSDSKCMDHQAAMESMASIMLAQMDGCNLVHDVGYLGQGLIGSTPSLIMCNEIISYVRRIARGFDMSPEHIGLDVIDKVGPGGNFLVQKHTQKHCRQEHWMNQFINRQNPDAWQQSGSKDFGQVVTEKARDILKTHKPDGLSDEIVKQLDEIIENNREALIGKQLSV